METTTNEQVKDAAEALVAVIKEVSLEVDSSASQQQQQSTGIIVESLKNSTDTVKYAIQTSNENLAAEVETVHQELHALKDEFRANSAISKSMSDDNEAMNEKIDSMSEHLASLQGDISAVKALLEAQETQRKLDFQISCAELNDFAYYKGYSSVKVQSSDLVRIILKRHALGQRSSIGQNLTTYGKSDDKEGRKDFRNKLKKQLKLITRSEPVFLKKNDDRYTILLS